ncbi:MAG: class I SAM-dependent methyltransferase [Alphaproteobacteria bacterium]|nr:class I SAM-dependent methyltransferase [Alphaproteobacteria bacterium]
MMRNPEKNIFGFTSVDPWEKTRRVNDVFSTVAQRYDMMNDVMSLGLHRLWKDFLVRRMRPLASERILDLAGGTGDMARRMARATAQKAFITVCDPSRAMMDIGAARAIDEGLLENIRWVEAYAEALPFEDDGFDLSCIVFGLRNVTHIDTALAELYRTLDTGGRFFCMEFSPDVSPALAPLYDLYSFQVIPFLGQRLAGTREAYQYLAESIRTFPNPQKLQKRMEKAGFEAVTWRKMAGGFVAVHTGWKL